MRKVGKNNVMKVDFGAYSYIINGVAGIGKTSMAHEVGLMTTGNDEGTFILSVGEEPTPDHIDGSFYDKAETWKEFIEITSELCKNKGDYPHTKFVALDSIDELFRIAENFVVEDFNKTVTDISKRAKSIKQALGGFQAGENRVVDVVIKEVFKLKKAGYSILFIGHTKVKTKTDPITEIAYEQLTCNLDNKYYNAIKDKVNLVAMCYVERKIENVKEEKDAFTKKMKKKGTLEGENRVIVFRDEDDMTVDTKSHFKNIQPKIEFSTESFIKAVEEAIKADLEEKRGVKVSDKDIKAMAKEQATQKEKVVAEKIADMVSEEVDVEENVKIIATIVDKVGNAKPDTVDKMLKILSDNGHKDFADPSAFKTSTLKEIIALF